MVGSLYILVAKKVQDATGQSQPDVSGAGCKCSHHGCCRSSPPGSRTSRESSPASHRRRRSDGPSPRASETQAEDEDAGYRRRFAKFLMNAGEWLGTPRDFDDSGFNHGRARNYPKVPGEERRNPFLRRTIDRYADRSHSNSAVGSVLPSEASYTEAEPGSRSQRALSPASWSSDGRQNEDLERVVSSVELHLFQGDQSPPIEGRPAYRPRPRRNTLEVPSPVHLSRGRPLLPSTGSSNHGANN
jgi:hypothetical protein